MNKNTLTPEVKAWWTRKSHEARYRLAERLMGIEMHRSVGKLKIIRHFKNRTINELFKLSKK